MSKYIQIRYFRSSRVWVVLMLLAVVVTSQAVAEAYLTQTPQLQKASEWNYKIYIDNDPKLCAGIKAVYDEELGHANKIYEAGLLTKKSLNVLGLRIPASTPAQRATEKIFIGKVYGDTGRTIVQFDAFDQGMPFTNMYITKPGYSYSEVQVNNPDKLSYISPDPNKTQLFSFNGSDQSFSLKHKINSDLSIENKTGDFRKVTWPEGGRGIIRVYESQGRILFVSSTPFPALNRTTDASVDVFQLRSEYSVHDICFMALSPTIVSDDLDKSDLATIQGR